MTFLDFDGIASGESIVVEGQMKVIASSNICSVDIIDPFLENEDVLRHFTAVDIHYHCWDDIDSITEEADEDGYLAFQVDDLVTVLCKIQGNYPDRSLEPVAVTGFVDEVRVCWGDKGVFKDGSSIYLADIENVDINGDPLSGGYSFTNLIHTGLSADDIFILSTREYWRCSGGAVYTGTINASGIASGEVSCAGFGTYDVRSLNVWLDGNTYKMVFRNDSDPNDELVNSQIIQCQSIDKITWTSFSTVRAEAICDANELVQEGYENANEITGAGYFEISDTYALENVVISTGNGNMVLRLFRIGKTNYFGDRSAWTALGKVSDDSYRFYTEASFSIEGHSVSTTDILQVIRI